jgi:fused signal recognition particle receptor
MGFFGRLRDGLTRTKQQLVERFEEIVQRADAGERRSQPVDVETIEALEELLISADGGVAATDRIVSAVKARARHGESLRDLVKQEIRAIFDAADATGNGVAATAPTVILIVGVNGTGKTTTVGKLANLLKNEGKSPLVCAAP